MIKLEVTRGTSADWDIQIYNRNGETPVAGDFLATDTLAATVSIGESYPAVFVPTASWSTGEANPDTGIVHVSVDDTDSDVEAGDYLLIVTNERDGRTAVIVRCVLRILGAVGTTTEPAVYCSYQDLRDELPWVDELKDDVADVAGFLTQRGRAREWMDNLILQSQPRTGWGLDSSKAGSWTWNFTRGSTSGDAFAADETLAGYLDDDMLMLTGAYGQRIIDACTYYALSLILRRTRVQKAGVSTANLAQYYARKANNTAITTTAQIDTDDDGVADIAISLAVTNSRIG